MGYERTVRQLDKIIHRVDSLVLGQKGHCLVLVVVLKVAVLTLTVISVMVPSL